MLCELEQVVRKLHTIRVEVGGTRDSGTAVIAWFDLLRVRRVDYDERATMTTSTGMCTSFCLICVSVLMP